MLLLEGSPPPPPPRPSLLFVMCCIVFVFVFVGVGEAVSDTAVSWDLLEGKLCGRDARGNRRRRRRERREEGDGLAGRLPRPRPGGGRWSLVWSFFFFLSSWYLQLLRVSYHLAVDFLRHLQTQTQTLVFINCFTSLTLFCEFYGLFIIYSFYLALLCCDWVIIIFPCYSNNIIIISLHVRALTYFYWIRTLGNY